MLRRVYFVFPATKKAAPEHLFLPGVLPTYSGIKLDSDNKKKEIITYQ